MFVLQTFKPSEIVMHLDPDHFDVKLEQIVLKIIAAKNSIRVAERNMARNPHKYTKQVRDKYQNNNSKHHNIIAKCKMRLLLLGHPVDETIEYYSTYKLEDYSTPWDTTSRRRLTIREQLSPMNWDYDPHTSQIFPEQTNKSKWKGESPYSSKSKWR